MGIRAPQGSHGEPEGPKHDDACLLLLNILDIYTVFWVSTNPPVHLILWWGVGAWGGGCKKKYL